MIINDETAALLINDAAEAEGTLASSSSHSRSHRIPARAKILGVTVEQQVRSKPLVVPTRPRSLRSGWYSSAGKLTRRP